MSDLGTSLLQMLDALDELPEDHEPDTEDLWETLRNIRKLVEKSQELGFTIDSYCSVVDGTTVVHVDTEGLNEDIDGPIIRVYLNDEVLFENPKLAADTARPSAIENEVGDE